MKRQHWLNLFSKLVLRLKDGFVPLVFYMFLIRVVWVFRIVSALPFNGRAVEAKPLRFIKTLRQQTVRRAANQLKKMPARHVVSNGISNNNIKYSRLATDDDGYIDLQVGASFQHLIFLFYLTFFQNVHCSIDSAVGCACRDATALSYCKGVLIKILY